MGLVLNMGDPAKHFWLTRSVARSMGINFSEAMIQGRISPQGYANLVTQCRKCTFVQQCENWLAQTGADHSSAPPDCANASALNNLKH
jgi:hypothetical protein